MKVSRRQFIGFIGALGLSSCARMGVDELTRERFKPKINYQKLARHGRLTFAAINDLHVLDAKSTGIVNWAVRQINESKEVAFTVVLGDVGTAGTLEEMNLAKKSLDRLKRPYFCLPGNHDVDPAATDPYANYEQAFKDMRAWIEKEMGWVFMGIDTCNGAAPEVAVPAERMQWIRERLAHIAPRRPIALFGHHPFNPNSKAYRVKNADEVLALFAGHNLKLVASGHYHGNQVEERDGILFTTTACCSTTRDNIDGTTAKGYRLFHLDKTSVSQHEFVEVSV